MQQETQFYRSLFDDAPFPYQSLDSEGRMLAVNKAWQSELGYEKHEVLGRLFSDFICSDQRGTFRERFAHFVSEGSVQGIVWQLIRKDGSPLTVSLSGRIVRDENSRFQRTQCMFFDLSKRSESEEKLRESEELRMAFMEASEEGFALYDAELRLCYINPAAESLFGAPESELLGKTMAELSPGVEQTDRYDLYRRVLETGQSFSINEYRGLPHSDGDWYAVQAFKIGDNLGVIWRDVTESKRSQQQLQESETRWRSMAEDSPDHVMLLDSDLKIQYANYASPGLTVGELIGSSLYNHVDVDDRDRVRLSLQTALESGELTKYETEYNLPDGAKLFYESRVVPRVVDGRTVELIVTARDITNLKTHAERIERMLLRETTIASLAEGFGRASSLSDIYRMTYRQVKGVMTVDSFIISRFSPANEMIHAAYVMSDGVEQETSVLPSLPLASEGKGMQSQVIRTGKPTIVGDTDTVMRVSENTYKFAGQNVTLIRQDQADYADGLPRSCVLVPLRVRDEIVGVMQAQSYTLNAYDLEDADLLVGLAGITAVAIENRELIKQSQKSYEGIIQALAKAIELRDPYTSQHQVGVALLATRIARILNLPDDQIRAIDLAAHIHDIGKVIIPAEILSKPSQLSGAQMSIVQSHVAAAHEVLEGIAFPWPIGEIVVQHHERMDGSGYPAGLQGEDIRIEARVLGVADIADAMMSHRPYRPAFSLEATRKELLQLRGSALDASVVDACVTVLSSESDPLS